MYIHCISIWCLGHQHHYRKSVLTRSSQRYEEYSQRQGEPCSSSSWDLVKHSGRENAAGRMSGRDHETKRRENRISAAFPPKGVGGAAPPFSELHVHVYMMWFLDALICVYE